MPNATPWSHEEDIRLCRAYTNISEDGCISTARKRHIFGTEFIRRTLS
ncbi:hypothetical protein F441_02090 [Phytophthora nicotianae CJ01A1]|uniref:Uncharacterized protein n=1 Tax=Phytophthora nicotianae CJ01A1 TaxID=1317063 RepID=W2XR54_PHYNI|nr:hypothetical protein F441_02090 [Phytophthora nicotianae CJ01A1]